MRQPKTRLESLDVLRGLDLFLLVGLQPLLLDIGQLWHNPHYHDLLYQFDHEVWIGFRLWDLIMPLFLFMTGITIPFSMDSKKGHPSVTLYGHLIRRFIILWLIGMFMQGNLMALDMHKLKLYSNTLQAIAVGYLFTSVLYLNFKLRTLLYIAVALLVVYAIPFMVGGDYSPQNNFAIRLDRLILGPFMDGAYWTDDHSWAYSSSYDYTWIWSSLTFTVTVMMGCFAGKIIKDDKGNRPLRVTVTLVLIGFALIFVGWIWGLYMPIIKRIWTSSMVLFSGGICFVLMGLTFYIIDVRQWKKPFLWLKIYGMNSIVAYVLGEHINLRPIVHVFTYGLENHFENYKQLILTSGNYLLVFCILLFLYRCRVFVKI